MIRAVCRDQHGFALIAALFMLLFIGALGGAVAVIAARGALAGESEENAEKAYYAAQAGMEWALRRRADSVAPFYPLSSDFNAGPLSWQGADQFTIRYSAATDTLVSAATVGAATREITVSPFCAMAYPTMGTVYECGANQTCPAAIDPSGPLALLQQAASGNGKLTGQSAMAGFALPVASVSQNGNTGTSPINGTGNTLPQGGTVNYISFNGGFVQNANATLTLNGPSATGQFLTLYINGDMILNPGAVLTINGNVRIVVNGSLSMGDGSSLFIASGGAMLIENSGAVLIGNNVGFNAGGSASSALVMSGGNVTTGNGVTFSGGIYSLGNIQSGNSSSFTGAHVSAGSNQQGTGTSLTPPPTGTGFPGQQVLATISAC